MKTYNPSLIGRARAMRRKMTVAEKRLWYDGLQCLPYRFRRQRPIGRFIVDFYCPELKLVIEVDGESHFSDQGLAYDDERTSFLESLGLKVMRFANSDVMNCLESICDQIVIQNMKKP